MERQQQRRGFELGPLEIVAGKDRCGEARRAPLYHESGLYGQACSEANTCNGSAKAAIRDTKRKTFRRHLERAYSIAHAAGAGQRFDGHRRRVAVTEAQPQGQISLW